MKIEVQDDHWIVTVSVVLADAVTRTAGILAYCKRVGFCGTEACPQDELEAMNTRRSLRECEEP